MNILLLLIISFILNVNEFDYKKEFPKEVVSTLDGKKVNTSDYIGKGNPVIISFWATWCKPCISELDNIAGIYEEWQEKYNVNLIAITTDNSRGLRKVPALVSSKGWSYSVLADDSGKLALTLGIISIPQSYLLDGEGNIVYSHTGYSPGDEIGLEKKLQEVSGK